mmetsp:Transcript_6886/g.20105  ORF Transcript_6886/g.20105 Transcript_6886/m.20105 type:complete len:410 (-) Transcript_6886:1224-2453(-)
MTLPLTRLGRSPTASWARTRTEYTNKNKHRLRVECCLEDDAGDGSWAEVPGPRLRFAPDDLVVVREDHLRRVDVAGLGGVLRLEADQVVLPGEEQGLVVVLAEAGVVLLQHPVKDEVVVKVHVEVLGPPGGRLGVVPDPHGGQDDRPADVDGDEVRGGLAVGSEPAVRDLLRLVVAVSEPGGEPHVLLHALQLAHAPRLRCHGGRRHEDRAREGIHDLNAGQTDVVGVPPRAEELELEDEAARQYRDLPALLDRTIGPLRPASGYLCPCAAWQGAEPKRGFGVAPTRFGAPRPPLPVEGDRVREVERGDPGGFGNKVATCGRHHLSVGINFDALHTPQGILKALVVVPKPEARHLSSRLQVDGDCVCLVLPVQGRKPHVDVVRGDVVAIEQLVEGSVVRGARFRHHVQV